jgi:hypothetical protein
VRVDSYDSYQSNTTDRLLPQPDWERRQGCAPLVLSNFEDVGNWTIQELRGQLEHLVADNTAAEKSDRRFPEKERRLVTENMKIVSEVCDRLAHSHRVRDGAGAELDIYKALNDQLYRRWTLTFDKPRPCVACGEEKNAAELSGQVTARCTHVSGCCKPCLRNWIAAQLETNTWDRIKCPECPEILRRHDIRSAASRETYSRYDSSSFHMMWPIQ